MLRIRSVNACLRRLFHGGKVTLNKDKVMEHLEVCSSEDQLFDVVDKNKTELSVNHVSCAVGMLWQFQKDRCSKLRTMEHIRSHPEFLTLRVLAANKVDLMDDVMLVDMLYALIRLCVAPHDSLIQQLVSEAWLRMERLPMRSLSKFAVCLSYQHLERSPLMGRITNIVAQKLSSIDDARVLSILMISVSSLASPRLCDAFISKADDLLDKTHPLNYTVARKVVQFLRNIKYTHLPLLHKCNQIFLRSVCQMDAQTIGIIMGLYQYLHFSSCDFRLAAKQRLTELIDSNIDPFSFTKLFISLAPLASPETREWLESTALLLADELDLQRALFVAEVLGEIQSRNLRLLHKISSVIQTNLHAYKAGDVVRITQAFLMLGYKNPEFFAKLRSVLLNFLQHTFISTEVATLTSILSMLPWVRLDEDMISRLAAVSEQCSLSKLNNTSLAVAKWVHNNAVYHHRTSRKYVRLLQTLNRSGRDRLRAATSLDSVLEEIRFISGEWFEEILLEETMATLQRLKDQLNCRNVTELALFLARINALCPPLMDRIASVVIKDINEIHHLAIPSILHLFSALNYDSITARNLYEACIDHVAPHISSFDPHMLVFLAHTLALADYFPQEIINQIFSIDFLRKLDAELDAVSDHLKMQTRARLMELNRAVCLECPQFQVPWFHKDYCQQLQNKGEDSVSPMHQQIYKILGEVLGGTNYVRAGNVTPYFYTVDFECILNKHHQLLAYSKPNTLQMSDREMVYWSPSSVENLTDELPPGAQRVAVDFLDSRNFCNNSHHMKGETVMRKRHLEILGYHVVQIPHFEWNSMELSTQDAWKEYLKKKIFG